MKNLKTFTLTATFLFMVVFSFAQTADEIIAKYVQAIGGKELLTKMTSLYTESKIAVMGMESLAKATTLNGKGYKQEMEFNGAAIVNCITDKGGWAINPMMGGSSAQDMPEAQYNATKSQIFIGAPFVFYAEKGYKAELLGNEAVGTINALKVKLTAPDNTSAVHFFDPGTGYLIKTVSQTEMQGQQAEMVMTFSDYKPVEGYSIPHTTNMNMGGMVEMASTVSKVEVNKPVDAAFFNKP